jgi:hypothetical protein
VEEAMQDKVIFVKQRGGAAKPRTWILIALLVAGLASAAMNIYLMRHQTIEIIYTSPVLPTTQVKDNTDADVGVVHILNDGGMGVCTFADAICWTRT